MTRPSWPPTAGPDTTNTPQPPYLGPEKHLEDIATEEPTEDLGVEETQLSEDLAS